MQAEASTLLAPPPPAEDGGKGKARHGGRRAQARQAWQVGPGS